MKTLTTLALLALAPLALGAQETSGFRFGLSLGAASTLGSAKDFNSKPRLDLGLHTVYGLEGGHALRGSLHLLGSVVSETQAGAVKYERSLPGTQLMAEYLYYPSGKVAEGFYVSGGLGLDSVTAKVTWPGYETKTSTNRLVPTLGAGYDFTSNMGVSLRYVHGAAEIQDPVLKFSDKRPPLGTLSAAFRYTF